MSACSSRRDEKIHWCDLSHGSYRHYWQKNSSIYGNKFVQKTMLRDLFLAILQFLHFGDNNETYNNRLGKVKYFIDHLNNTMKDMYAPEGG